MNQNRTRRKHMWLHIKSGINELVTCKWKAILFFGYLTLAILLWVNRYSLIPVGSTNLLFKLCTTAINLLVPFISIVGLAWLLSLAGTPYGSKGIHESLLQVGFTNHAGQHPILLSRRKRKDYPRVVLLEFENAGISILEWDKKCSALEAALNLHIAEIEPGKNNRRVILHTVPAKNSSDKNLYWNDVFLKKEDFALVLGESIYGQEVMNLSVTPHALIGGSTGSGKSLLLKLLLMQCKKKGAAVHICDFKGGVDFPPIWHEECDIITSENKLLELLDTIVNELSARKKLLRDSGHANISEYNQGTSTPLQRIILACDEISEVLDKTGRSKEEKEFISKIEGRLSIIARQGRAFGIHLILATQRPDATILSGQIRNNIDFRVCGRADNVLSQIILDNTDAADKIEKNAQGKFLRNNGVVFQGYLFDERKII